MGNINFKLKILIVTASISLLLITSSLTAHAISAPCFPFRTKIDSIENGRECLKVREYRCSTSIDVLNHCRDEFHPYDEQGNLNTREVIMNYEENVNSDGKKYYDLERATGIKYIGVWFPPQTRFDESPCEDYEVRLVNGINVCDLETLEKATDKTIKSWTVKLRSKNTGQDTTIYGRTLHQKSGDTLAVSILVSFIARFFLTAAIAIFVTAILLLLMKYVFKKKIQLAFIVILIITAVFFYLAYIIPQYLF